MNKTTQWDGRHNLWIITKDHIEDGAAVGIGSPYWKDTDVPADRSAWNRGEIPPEVLKEYELNVRFKMYDDDGNLYYEGRMQIEDFHPMDDFGMPNSGCTELWYSRNNEAFKMLQEEYDYLCK